MDLGVFFTVMAIYQLVDHTFYKWGLVSTYKSHNCTCSGKPQTLQRFFCISKVSQRWSSWCLGRSTCEEKGKQKPWEEKEPKGRENSEEGPWEKIRIVKIRKAYWWKNMWKSHETWSFGQVTKHIEYLQISFRNWNLDSLLCVNPATRPHEGCRIVLNSPPHGNIRKVLPQVSFYYEQLKKHWIYCTVMALY